MPHRFLPALRVAAVPPLHAQTATVAAATGVPLIERAKFFGNPSKTGGRLSPDGRWLSWVAPRDGVLNLWVAPLDKPEQAHALTNERQRPIRISFWSPDSKTLLYVNDQGGDENFRLYGVDVTSGALKSYTPFDKSVVQVIGISPKVKDSILIGLNNRDPRFHDVHSLSLATGELSLVLKNEGFGSFHADRDLNLRLASRPNAEGGSDYFRSIYAVPAGSTRTISVDPSDDLKITPTAATCSACHDKAEVRSHMIRTGGASFATPQRNIGVTVKERCASCHGPGKEKDVRRAHEISSSEGFYH